MALAPVIAALATVAGAASPPHIISVMVDDLGYFDTQVHNPNAPTPTIGKLAKNGITLTRHYVYMYCSPTRRSFLAGRFPTHINPNQPNICDNFLPLQFTIFPQKLSTLANYTNHFVGKGHLSYATYDHLPIRRGYDSHVGYLGGAESYDQFHLNSHDFWDNDRPANESLLADVWYSTNYYTTRSLEIIRKHNQSTPLYLDLRYQGVHGPYVEPPRWEQVSNTSANNQICGSTYSCQIMESMVKVVDDGVYNITTLMKSNGMWNNTFMIFFGDNGGGMGGDEPSNNYPLRGTKGEPWDGGIRVAAFVSGGLIPDALRGTSNDAFISVADWYPTILGLAGLSPQEISDTVVYNGAARPLDGIDAWPVLMGNQRSLGREWLPTTNQSIVWNSTWKLITTAPSTHWFTPTDGHIEDGWPCRATTARNISTRGMWQCEVCSDDEPCLFHIIDDPAERNDVAKENPEIVERMRAAMHGLNFPPYVNGSLLPSEIEKYVCLLDGQGSEARHQWWGGMAGPCCHPKGVGPWPPPGPPRPNPTPNHHPGLHSNIDALSNNFTHNTSTGEIELRVGGWAWNGSWPGGGLAPVQIRFSVDEVVAGEVSATIVRPRIVNGGAPNTQHGFSFTLSGRFASTLASSGSHILDVEAGNNPNVSPQSQTWSPLSYSPRHFRDGRYIPDQLQD